MDIEIGLLTVCQKPTEILEGNAIAIDCCILTGNKEVSKVEVFLHEECNIDGRDCEEKSGSILLHLHY